MFWYRKKALIVAVSLALAGLVYSCQPELKNGGKATYLDIKGYFNQQAAQLQKHNRPVLKTAMHNNEGETKQVTIANWQHELSLFVASDINKPAWRKSYIIIKTGDTVIYRTNDPDLETRDITIVQSGKTVKCITINNHTKNLLYETSEKLTWVPDTVYHIEKWQKVRFLGENHYDIKGLWR